MGTRQDNPIKYLTILAIAALIGASLGCNRSLSSLDDAQLDPDRQTLMAAIATAKVTIGPGYSLPTARAPGAPILTPTPDAPHLLPTLRNQPESYAVQAGDTLGQIASRYGVGVDQIAQANSLVDVNVLAVGQSLNIPPPTPGPPGPAFKIIPDSELIFSPSSLDFDVEAFVQSQGGILANYWEEVDGEPMNGAQIVLKLSQDYSVNPRMLLALLEHQTKWLTNLKPEENEENYPVGLLNPQSKGLYRQLSWAADQLNRGYYLWRVNGIGAWILKDGSVVPAAATINAGTAGVQNFFAQLLNRTDWEAAVTEAGLFATYNSLFGYPFDRAIEPLLPAGLSQPSMQLPFEPGMLWSFTGGPHGAWGSGSAWAALDFGPPGEALGCVPSDAWVVAVASGMILRADHGAVIQDLDGDGNEQTGWVVLYMHIDSKDRVQPGVFLNAGERIGHPSCEGGVSTGTHVHLARRYNGEWISADQDIPFRLDGWVSIGAGSEYDGYLQLGEQEVEAYAGNSPDNLLQR